jgi:hypothetical protein
MHWNVSIGPEKWPIFGRFLTLFQLKRPARRNKNTSNMAATVGKVIDDVTCKSSIEGSNNQHPLLRAAGARNIYVNQAHVALPSGFWRLAGPSGISMAFNPSA